MPEKAESIIDTLKEMLDAEPFVPFQITATNGRHYDVRNPYGIALMRSQIFYSFPKTDKFVYIRIQEIVSLESLQAA